MLAQDITPGDEDTSEEPCTDHGLDECPDCGNGGVKVGKDGYEPCTRFLTCWSDPTPQELDLDPHEGWETRS